MALCSCAVAEDRLPLQLFHNLLPVAAELLCAEGPRRDHVSPVSAEALFELIERHLFPAHGLVIPDKQLHVGDYVLSCIPDDMDVINVLPEGKLGAQGVVLGEIPVHAECRGNLDLPFRPVSEQFIVREMAESQAAIRGIDCHAEVVRRALSAGLLAAVCHGEADRRREAVPCE